MPPPPEPINGRRTAAGQRTADREPGPPILRAPVQSDADACNCGAASRPDAAALTRLFTYSAGAVLIVTGGAKLLSTLGGSNALAQFDPIIGLSFRRLMLLVGTTELLVAYVCLVGHNPRPKLGLVAWLSAGFAAYRVGLWWLGWHQPCRCLGSLTDLLHVSPRLADNVMKGVLAYLFIGSLTALGHCLATDRWACSGGRHNGSRSWIRRVVVVLGILLAPRLYAASEMLRFEGFAEATLYFGAEIKTLPQVSFTVTLDNDGWLIHYVHDEGPNTFDYKELACDGTNVYFIGSMKRAVEEQRKRGYPVAGNVATGIQYKGHVCSSFLVKDACAIWLTYASGSYFASRTNNLVEPPMCQDSVSGAMFGPSAGHLTVPASWVLTESRPQFPAEVAYFNDGTRLMRKGPPVRLDQPYEAGFTTAQYKVEAFTNIAGLRVPSASILRQFRMKTDAKSNSDLYLVSEVRVRLTRTDALERTADFSFQPRFPGITFVSVPDVARAAGYMASNRWASEQEARSFHLDMQRRATRASFRGTLKVRLCLAAVIALPLVIYGCRRFLSRRPRSSEEVPT